MKQDCKRCNCEFKANTLIQGDDVCPTCDRMNCITFWYPRLQRLGFPMPKTEILYTDLPLEMLADGEMPLGIDMFITDLRHASTKVGLHPVFLRTGFLSNKHDWKNSCFLDKETLMDKKKVLKHVANLVEMSMIATIDRIMPIDFWAVREFIPIQPYFIYFPGEMPITKERRYFIKNGQIDCDHNYWDRGAFDEVDEKIFTKMSELSDEDRKITDGMAQYISGLFSGSWSLDFLKGKNGKWYLTDMAIGEKSYHQKHVLS